MERFCPARTRLKGETVNLSRPGLLLEPGAHLQESASAPWRLAPGSDETATHRPPPAPALRARRGSRGAAVLSGRAAPRPLAAARVPARPLAAGGVHVEGGLGWHPERGEVAGKLKRAARRPGAGVPGPDRKGASGLLARGRMRLPVEGTDVSLGPRSCCRSGCPSHPGTDAAAGWSLCASGLMSFTRYVLPRPGVRARGDGGEGRAVETLRGSCHLHVLRPTCSSTPGWNTLDGLRDAAASTWSGQSRDQRWAGTRGAVPRGWGGHLGYPCPLLSRQSVCGVGRWGLERKEKSVLLSQGLASPSNSRKHTL